MSDVETVDPIDEVEVTEDSEAPEQDQAEEQPRNEKGQYAEAEDKSQEAQEAPEPPDTPDTEEGVQVVEPVPYRYRADQREYAIGTVGDDGAVSISPDEVPHLEQLLASGRHWADQRPRERADYQRQIDTAQAEVTAAEAVRQSLMDEFERIANLGEDDLTDYMAGLKAEWPKIKAEAESKGFESKNQAQSDELAQYKRDERERALQPQVLDGLEREMVRAIEDDARTKFPRFQALTLEDKRAIFGRLTQDGWRGLMVMKDPVSGLVTPWQGEGEPQLDNPRMLREMEYVASLRGTKQDSTTEDAKKANAAELSETKAPPAVKANSGPTPASGPVPRFKRSKDATALTVTQEVDDYIDDLEIE